MNDTVSKWAKKLAEEATPDEVDLAPIMAQAYISGGKEREELFRQSGGVQGAFGAETVVILFPYILDAIQAAGPYLLNFLGSISGFFAGAQPVIGGTSQLLGAINTLLAITHFSKREEKKQSLPHENQELARFKERYEEFQSISTLLREELLRKGIDEDEADLISYRILKAMLEDPSRAAQFTEEVAKAS
jgi:hypothetical protein